MTPARGIAVVACAITVIATIHDSAADSNEKAIRFLQTEYLDSDNVQTISFDNATLALRHAIALFQEYYRNGVLNDATLKQMRKPQYGVRDISNSALDKFPRKCEDAPHLELSLGERECSMSHRNRGRDVGGKFVVEVRARFDESRYHFRRVFTRS
ncbi:hypothetical protein P5V15_008312 [Pogonomyrmex californicus]